MLNETSSEQPTVTSLTPLLWNAALVVMGACLGTGLAALAGLLVPGPYASVLPWLALLISIEALYSRAVSRRINRTLQQRLLYTASEWIVIGIVLKFIILAGNGFSTLASEAQSWLADFYNYIFEPAFLLSLITLVVVSFAVRVLADDLAPLAMDERKMIRQMQATEMRGGLSSVRDSLAGHIIAVGISLTLALSLATLVREITPALQGAGVPAMALLIYFTISLLLLGHTRVRAATNTWAIEGVDVEAGLGTRWAGIGLAIVLVVAAIALLLAAGNPLTLFESLSSAVRSVLLGILYLVSMLWMVLLFAFQIIMYGLFSLLAFLFGTAPPAPPQMQTPEQAPLEQATGNALNFPWGSALLVVLGIAVVVGAIYYLISRRLPADELRNAGGLFGLLRRRLAAFWLWLKGILARPSALLNSLRRDEAKQPAVKEAVQTMGKRPNLKDMTARAIVRHYYSLLLQRGAQSGMPRNPAQTPREYAQMLDQRAPDAAPDVDQLTETFVEARYSTHDVSEQQAAAVREWFTHIRNSLRPRRKGSKP